MSTLNHRYFIFFRFSFRNAFPSLANFFVGNLHTYNYDIL